MMASDPGTNQSGSSDIPTRGVDKAGLSQKAFDWLFGYDYFIAHRSVDGKNYASALYNALTTKGNELDCFLDVKHYGAGGGLTNMQSRALRKTTRLIVIVTPHAHDADAPYLRGEVAQFRRVRLDGIIVPIGTWKTLTEKHYPNSQLLPLLPHLPDDICILESPEQLGKGEPSPQTVAKLLNDFSEERRSTKRLRWIRRAAILLFILLSIAVWQGIRAELQRREANRQKHEAIKLTSRLYETVEMIGVASRMHPDNSGFAISPDASAFVTFGKDGTVKLWRTKDMSDYFHLPAQLYEFIAGRFGASVGDNRDSTPWISLSRQQAVSNTMIETEGYRPIELPSYRDGAEGARFSPNGAYVATWGDKSVLNVSGDAVIFSTSLTDAIVFAMPNESGRIVMVQTADGSIVLLNTQTKQLIKKQPGNGEPTGFIDRVMSFNDQKMSAIRKDGSAFSLPCAAAP